MVDAGGAQAGEGPGHREGDSEDVQHTRRDDERRGDPPQDQYAQDGGDVGLVVAVPEPGGDLRQADGDGTGDDRRDDSQKNEEPAGVD